MKVLITTDLYATSTNGVVTSVRNLMEELVKKDHEVRVLTVSEKLRSYKEDNIYYIRLVPLGAIYPDVRMPVSYRHHYIKELIGWRPDVIHSQCEYFSCHFAEKIEDVYEAVLQQQNSLCSTQTAQAVFIKLIFLKHFRNYLQNLTG